MKVIPLLIALTLVKVISAPTPHWCLVQNLIKWPKIKTRSDILFFIYLLPLRHAREPKS